MIMIINRGNTIHGKKIDLVLFFKQFESTAHGIRQDLQQKEYHELVGFAVVSRTR